MDVCFTKSDGDTEVDIQAATWLKVIIMKFSCDILLKVPWLSFAWFKIQ